MVHALFMLFDTDRNGVISAAEFEAVTKAIKQLDLNGDGQITPEECVAFGAQAGGHGGGAGGGGGGQGGGKGGPGGAGGGGAGGKGGAGGGPKR